jgi:outer membrane protein assembly factor BamB
VAWRYAPKDRQFPFYSSAAVADGKVILGGRDKVVHAIDEASGKPVWTFTTRARVESSAAVAGSRVFIGSSDGRFYVLDLKSGKPVWQYEAGAPFTASPAVANGAVVIGTTDGTIICFG